jgi:transcriptional regulator with XRE-family HTH domain
MARGSVDPAFGVLLKTLRLKRNMSLRRLGQQVHCSHGYLWDLESSTKRPSTAVAALLDATLDAGGELLGLASAISDRVEATGGAGTGSSDPGLEYAVDWQRGVDVVSGLWRDDALQGSRVRGTGFVKMTSLPSSVAWMTVPLEERPERNGQRLVGGPEIEAVRRVTAVYRALDNQYGGARIRDGLVRFLATEVAGLLRGRYDRGTGRRLMSAAAEATLLVGWSSYDAGLHGLAQRYLIQAARLAATASDLPLRAEIIAAMSHQAAYLKASKDAVGLARAAGALAAQAGISAIVAESAVLEAQGHAAGGDEAECAAALDRADRSFDSADRTSHPQWIGYFDEAYLSAKFGHCFVALGQGTAAEGFAVSSLDMNGKEYARGRQFNLALLALARLQGGDPEHAAVVGVEAVEAAENLSSVRALDYLTALAEGFRAYQGLPEVDEFNDRLRALQPV